MMRCERGRSASRRVDEPARDCPGRRGSRADRSRPATVNSFASCRDVQRTLRSGNASRPAGNIFRLRRPTPSAARVFGRAAENSIERSPAPKVFASSIFGRCSTPVRARSPGRGNTDSTACMLRSMHQSWYGAPIAPATRSAIWSPESRQIEIAILLQNQSYCSVVGPSLGL